MTTSKQCFCNREGLGDPNATCGDCPTRDYNTPEQHSLPQRMDTRAGSDMYAQGWNDALAAARETVSQAAHEMRHTVYDLLTNATLEQIKDMLVYFKTICEVEPGQHGTWDEADQAALEVVKVHKENGNG